MKERILNYLSFDNRKVFILRIILIISALFLLISLVLPYATASLAFKENLILYGDRVVDKDTGFTGNALINMNLFEFITLHVHDTSYDGSGLIVGLLVAIVVLTFLTVILVGLKKNVFCAVTSILTFLLVLLINFDFSDRGLVGYNYEWGVAHFFYIFFTIIIIASAIVSKILNKIDKTKRA